MNQLIGAVLILGLMALAIWTDQRLDALEAHKAKVLAAGGYPVIVYDEGERRRAYFERASGTQTERLARADARVREDVDALRSFGLVVLPRIAVLAEPPSEPTHAP